MAKAVRLSDIAQCCDVSIVTVSKALSGQKGMSEEKRQEILTVAKNMGYTKHPKQEKEKGKKGYTIGVLVEQKYMEPYESFCWKMYQQLVFRASSKNCFLLLEVLEESQEKERILPKLVIEGKVDGIIYLGKIQSEYLEYLNRILAIPKVYLDFYDGKKDTDAVLSDNYYGGYCMTKYLFSLGHEQVGFVGNIRETDSVMDRYLGYQRAVLENGKSLVKEWILSNFEEKDQKTGREYLKLPLQLPTAFVCAKDKYAAELIEKLEKRGQHVPEDISVTGYDYDENADNSLLKITTYEVNIEGMAQKAIQKIYQKIQGEISQERITIVEGKLVERNSCRERNREGYGSETHTDEKRSKKRTDGTYHSILEGIKR